MILNNLENEEDKNEEDKMILNNLENEEDKMILNNLENEEDKNEEDTSLSFLYDNNECDILDILKNNVLKHNLEVIKNIKTGEKLSINDRYILNIDILPYYVNFNCLLKVKRRFTGQNRHLIINFINNLVDISLKKISASELDKNDLLSILNGLKTLKITYNDDEIIKNNIDMIRDKIINNNNIYYK